MNHTSNSDTDWLDLADAITLLRDQIVEAQARIAGPPQEDDNPPGDNDKGVRFELAEITLELSMDLTRTNEGRGGLRFAVMGVGLDLGGKRERSNSNAHTVTVRLIPRHGGGPVEVRDLD
ncbi:trypco2 family protein [Kitasatospora aureofaciens]|uniref:trypco2 family protein n=1 Tax=Kitasatospora aureofaciens TaxID=1894 RepID=UPI0037C6E472